VGEGGVESVGDGAGLLPDYLVDDLEPQPLERKPEAEDDVVRPTHPQCAIGLEDMLGVTRSYRTFTRSPARSLSNGPTMSGSMK
jgi:hypothetical protein